MDVIKRSSARIHSYYDGSVQVTEYNFPGNGFINDAEIIIKGRYPKEGYSINDISIALISIESGTATLSKKTVNRKKLKREIDYS